MLQPIQRDNELVCPGCGAVVGLVSDYQESSQKSLIDQSLNIHLLGSALEKNVRHSLQRTREQLYEERVLRNLINITKDFVLPEMFAYDTFNAMKKKNRGFYSEIEPIKQLIKILSKDDNYMYIHKLRAIKKKYETLLNP